MRARTVTRLLAATVATAAVSGGGVAVAQNGADDPAGHVRGGHGADDRAGHVRHRHRHGADDLIARASRRGADDPAGDVKGGHGADDGPLHA